MFSYPGWFTGKIDFRQGELFTISRRTAMAEHIRLSPYGTTLKLIYISSLKLPAASAAKGQQTDCML